MTTMPITWSAIGAACGPLQLVSTASLSTTSGMARIMSTPVPTHCIQRSLSDARKTSRDGAPQNTSASLILAFSSSSLAEGRNSTSGNSLVSSATNASSLCMV